MCLGETVTYVLEHSSGRGLGVGVRPTPRTKNPRFWRGFSFDPLFTQDVADGFEVVREVRKPRLEPLFEAGEVHFELAGPPLDLPELVQEGEADKLFDGLKVGFAHWHSGNVELITKAADYSALPAKPPLRSLPGA